MTRNNFLEYLAIDSNPAARNLINVRKDRRFSGPVLQGFSQAGIVVLFIPEQLQVYQIWGPGTQGSPKLWGWGYGFHKWQAQWRVLRVLLNPLLLVPPQNCPNYFINSFLIFIPDHFQNIFERELLIKTKLTNPIQFFLECMLDSKVIYKMYHICRQ